MEKLIFQGKVVDLYAEDYQRLQNTIDANLKTLFRITVNNPDEPAIIRGFNLQINSTNNTRIDIYHTTPPGAIVTGYNEVVESSKTYLNYPLPSYEDGQVYIIYANVIRKFKSFNPQTGEYEDSPKRLDLATYQYVYDTEVYDYQPAIYTENEYNNLSSEQKKNLIVLGSVTAHGVGQPLTDLNLDIRIYSAARQTSGAITEENISDSTRMPQYWVKSTLLTVPYVENDNFPSTSNKLTLVDDLNDLRTQIRKIKGTSSYRDEVDGSLANLDPLADSLHASGVDYRNANALKIIPYSGFQVRVSSGKCLVGGKILSLLPTSNVLIQCDPVPLYSVTNELYTVPIADVTNPGYTLPLYLSNNKNTGAIVIPPLGYDSVYVEENDPPGQWTFIPSENYIWTSEGSIIFNANVIEPGHTVRISYRYGYSRYDIIYVDSSNTFGRIEGTYTNSSQPVPIIPNPTTSDMLLLAAVKLYPGQSAISTADIVDLRVQVQPVRDIIALDSNSYIIQKIFKPNTFVYLNPTGIPEDPTNPYSFWKRELIGEDYRFTNSMSGTCEIYGYAYFPENSEMWIIREKNYADCSITLQFQSNPTNPTFSSSTINITKVGIAEEGPYLQKVRSNISKGYHKFIIQTSSQPFGFYGVVIGNLSTFYRGLQTGSKASIDTKLVTFNTLQTKILIDDSRKGIILSEPTSSSTNRHFCKLNGDYLTRNDCNSIYPIARRCLANLQVSSPAQYELTMQNLGSLSESNPLDKLFINIDTRYGTTIRCKWLRLCFTQQGSPLDSSVAIVLHDSNNNLIKLSQINLSEINLTPPTNHFYTIPYTYINLNDVVISTGVQYHIHIVRVGSSTTSTKIKTTVEGNANTAVFGLYYTPDSGLYPSDDSIRLYNTTGALIVPETSSGDNVLVNNIPPDERMLFPIAIDFSNDSFWNSWNYEQGYGVGIDYITGRIKFSEAAFQLLNS